ncbi:MAG: hypothetical protein AB7E55_10185 [Pigmentiphaga sp.]
MNTSFSDNPHFNVNPLGTPKILDACSKKASKAQRKPRDSLKLRGFWHFEAHEAFGSKR